MEGRGQVLHQEMFLPTAFWLGMMCSAGDVTEVAEDKRYVAHALESCVRQTGQKNLRCVFRNKSIKRVIGSVQCRNDENCCNCFNAFLVF